MTNGGRLLVLGGGGFLGYHVAHEALSQGRRVTVLSRSGTSSLDGVEVLEGDRNGPLDVLRGREWDAVVDTFTDDEPGAPAVRRTAAQLSGSVGTYCYVSGMSVYAPDGPAVPDEQAPVRARGVEPSDDPLQERSVAKLDAEAAVREAFDGAVLLPRVGIMVGPRDPSHRFTWWPVRFHRALTGAAGPSVPCPGRPTRPVQYSDARDIAAWLVRMSVAGRGGTFNAVGPLRADSAESVLTDCLRAAREMLADADQRRDTAVELQWHEDEDVLREQLQKTTDEDRPLWYPEDQIPQRAIDSTAAQRAGLRFRPALDTARDTLRWALRDDPEPLPDFAEPA